MSTPALWLASRSPRRAELLRLLGVKFRVLDVEVDESPLPHEPAGDYVTRLAAAKARAGRQGAPGAAPVLAADTTVVLDGRLLGKPRDREDGIYMLGALAGRWHEVHTGVALDAPDVGLRVVGVVTRVLFRALGAHEIAAYWASGEPADKAGGYGIQGLGGALVARLEGSYTCVVGLPLAETATLLTACGVPHALDGAHDTPVDA